MSEPLDYIDTLELLIRLGTVTTECVLVGGQAVNFWAERYVSRSSLLLANVPFSSKDVDFCGSVSVAEACARALGGRCDLTKPDDLTSCLGVVRYIDGLQRERQVDFLRAPYGLDAAEVQAMAIPVGAQASTGGVEFLVMHPAHVLESRASNVDGLPNYRTPQGLKQLRASVVCAREFARDLLEDGRARDVLRLNERLFRFALSPHGLGVRIHDGISVFDGILRDPRLPEAFERVRFPQMEQELGARRTHAAELAYRAGSVSLLVFEGHELRGNALVARLRGADGTLSELANYQPGNSNVRAGDLVRLGSDGQLDVIAAGRSRDRGRGR